MLACIYKVLERARHRISPALEELGMVKFCGCHNKILRLKIHRFLGMLYFPQKVILVEWLE